MVSEIYVKADGLEDLKKYVNLGNGLIIKIDRGENGKIDMAISDIMDTDIILNFELTSHQAIFLARALKFHAKYRK